MASQEREKRFPWQILLFVLFLWFLIVIYLIMWYGDAAKGSLLDTFYKIWVPSSVILLLVTFGTYRSSRFPFGYYPREFNLGLSALIGLLSALGLIMVNTELQKAFGGMGLLQLPELVAMLSQFFKGFPIKLQFKPVYLSWFEGLEAVGWQAIVSGVEEGFKLAFTLGVAMVLYVPFLRHYGSVSRGQKALILSLSVLIVGLTWVGMHGFHSYTYASEYLSAFLGLLAMSAMTFLTGNPFAAFFCHWWFNVLAPALAPALPASLVSSEMMFNALFSVWWLIALPVVLVSCCLLGAWLLKRRRKEQS